MKEIAAAKFKEQCLAILDEVDEDGIVITKRGRPVAKLIPIRADSASLIGSLKGKLTIKGDILSTSVVHNVALITRDRHMRRSRIVPLAR
jgi:prevent-host-death family protein